jgi:phospholipid-binding lipoprotein MlaA
MSAQPGACMQCSDRVSYAPLARRPWRALAEVALCLTLLLVVSGCATTPSSEGSGDPLEPMNRHIYKFNDKLDKAVLKPVADFYVRVTPEPVRNSVSHFFDNVKYPNVILNDFLQGKLQNGLDDIGRFTVNTTMGIVGLFDVASKMGMKPHDEDFGQTLGWWGSPAGPYLVLPLLGPNTVRDSPDLVVSTVTNVLFYVPTAAVTIPLSVLGVIDMRARASNAIRFVNEAALDPYVFTREAYLQRRVFLIYDGHPPMQFFDEDTGNESAPPEKSGAAPAAK